MSRAMSPVWDMRRVDAVRALRTRMTIDEEQLMQMTWAEHRALPTRLLEEIVHELRHLQGGIGALIHPEDLVIERYDEMNLQVADRSQWLGGVRSVVFMTRWDPSTKEVLLAGGDKNGQRLVFTKAPHDPLFLAADEEPEPWAPHGTTVGPQPHEVWEPAGWDTQQRVWIYERSS